MVQLKVQKQRGNEFDFSAAPAHLSQLSIQQKDCLANVLVHRGLSKADELEYSIKNLLSFKSLKDIEKAASLLGEHIRKQSNILVVGDFDADGATSTALMLRVLAEFGASNVTYLVPNRFEYGYGLSPEIVAVAAKRSPDLLITVDNGISSIEGVAAAKALGMDVLVTDHHLPGDQVPQADAIVNPNQHGCEFPSKAACGCTVAFYVLAAARQYLTQQQWFELQGIEAPNLAKYLDIVALATVADVVPLDANNRLIVQLGLQRIRSGRCIVGIQALLKVAKRSLASISSSDLGFALGPRLNAAGRLDDISTGIECLLTDNPELGLEIAQVLDDFNRDRKVIEQDMQHQALNYLEQINVSDQHRFAMSLYQPDWHQGVIGILASRIKDKFHRPVIAFARADDLGINGESEIKGSARSIKGLHIRDALDLFSKRYPNILNKFGGHAMAAGLTIKEKDFDFFQVHFNQVCSELLHEDDLSPELISDGELTGDCYQLEFAEMLSFIAPWGQNFSQPQFHGRFQIINQRLLGERHLKLLLKEIDSEKIVDAIQFNLDPIELGKGVWPDHSCQQVQCVFTLDVNEFRDQKNVQLMLKHVEKIGQ